MFDVVTALLLSWCVIGLYYPFVHFRNEAWLRLAVLYWDEMYRIVPSQDQPEDSPLVQTLLHRGGVSNGGFVKEAVPLDETREVGEAFVEFARRNRRKLQRSYSVSLQSKWPDADPVWLDASEAARGEKLASVFAPKLSEDVQRELVTSGLAEYDRLKAVLRMHPRLAFVLVSNLASAIGKSRLLSPVADDAIAQSGAAALTMDRLLDSQEGRPTRPADNQEVGALLLNVTLEAYAPDRFHEMPIDELLDLREDRWLELQNLRAWMNDLAKSLDGLGDVRDKAIVQERLQNVYDAQIACRLEALEGRERNRKWIATGGTLGLSIAIPATVSFLGGLADVAVNQPWLQVAGGALGLSKVVAEAEKARQTASDDKGAFLLHMKRTRPLRLPKRVPLG